jgi:GH35 family endo-1,4-beta-xylanase
MDYPTSKANMAVHNDRVAVDFGITLPYMNFAMENNLKMSAQALLWFMLTPDWFFRVDYDMGQALADRNLMLLRMENYIKDILTWCHTNYPGMFKMWVVCNESFELADLKPDNIRNDLWFQTVGVDYVERAFFYADKWRNSLGMNVDLVYNDYNIESNNNKMNALLDYIQKYNVKLDGVAFQMHTSLATPTVSVIKTNLEKIKNDNRVKAKNLVVYISEMDVKCDDNSSLTMTALSNRYKDLITTFLTADITLKGITWWCLNDGYTWLITNAGQYQYPLMFDANNQAKPAYYGVMQAGGAP